MTPSPPHGGNATGHDGGGAHGGRRGRGSWHPVAKPYWPLELAYLPIAFTREPRQFAVGVDDDGMADRFEHR